MPLLLKILFATFLSGVVSLLGGVALLARAEWVKKTAIYFVIFSAGALLSAAFLDLLPEAFEMKGPGSRTLFAYTLVGVLLFFLLERAILKYHSHHHVDEEYHHHPTPILMLVSGTVHNFVDGIVVAVAFIADPAIGVATAIAVGAHEIPKEIGDFSVMIHHGYKKSVIFWAHLISSLLSMFGAYLAYIARFEVEPYIAILLSLAAGHFIYIASADLIPEISLKTNTERPAPAILIFFSGVAIIWLSSNLFG